MKKLKSLDKKQGLDSKTRKAKKANINKTLGARLGEARVSEKNGYTQNAIGNYLGTSHSHIARIEEGKGNTNFADIKLLADFLGVSLDMLCSDIPLDQVKKIQSSCVYAILTVLKQLVPQVHVDTNKIIFTISSDNDSPNYSSHNILDFFKEYEIIQNFANSSGRDDMTKALMDNLEQKYSHLPGLPDYAKISADK